MLILRSGAEKKKTIAHSKVPCTVNNWYKNEYFYSFDAIDNMKKSKRVTAVNANCVRTAAQTIEITPNEQKTQKQKRLDSILFFNCEFIYVVVEMAASVLSNNLSCLVWNLFVYFG